MGPGLITKRMITADYYVQLNLILDCTDIPII